MDFTELIKQRSSCRNFLEQPVEQAKLASIIAQAGLAPSAVNGQPWFVHAVTSGDALNKTKTACTHLGMNRFVKAAPVLLVVTNTVDNIISNTISKIKDLDFKSIDIGIFVAYLTLAATKEGLGSCILGWFNEQQLKETLKLKKQEKVRLVIAIGYPKANGQKEKHRKTLDQICKFY
ncbi:MAG: nitroreductase family protein [Bacilli bacterium]